MNSKHHYYQPNSMHQSWSTQLHKFFAPKESLKTYIWTSPAVLGWQEASHTQQRRPITSKTWLRPCSEGYNTWLHGIKDYSQYNVLAYCGKTEHQKHSCKLVRMWPIGFQTEWLSQAVSYCTVHFVLKTCQHWGQKISEDLSAWWRCLKGFNSTLTIFWNMKAF